MTSSATWYEGNGTAERIIESLGCTRSFDLSRGELDDASGALKKALKLDEELKRSLLESSSKTKK